MQKRTIHNETKRYLLTTDDQAVCLLDDGETEATFTIIEQAGMLPEDSSFAVLNFIYVAAGQENKFEQRFLGRTKRLAQMPGFKAIRVLSPARGHQYLIGTWWESEQAFQNWQNSPAYQATHQKRATSEGLDHQQQVVDRNRSYHEGFQSDKGAEQ